MNIELRYDTNKEFILFYKTLVKKRSETEYKKSSINRDEISEENKQNLFFKIKIKNFKNQKKNN